MTLLERESVQTKEMQGILYVLLMYCSPCLCETKAVRAVRAKFSVVVQWFGNESYSGDNALLKFLHRFKTRELLTLMKSVSVGDFLQKTVPSFNSFWPHFCLHNSNFSKQLAGFEIYQDFLHCSQGKFCPLCSNCAGFETESNSLVWLNRSDRARKIHFACLFFSWKRKVFALVRCCPCERPHSAFILVTCSHHYARIFMSALFNDSVLCLLAVYLANTHLLVIL